MKIYVFENSYYIGDNISKELESKAVIKYIEVPDDKIITVKIRKLY